ncbi:MAG TPA: PadR family transcriptional regulator [Solirubrobacteraceae bacterium]|jgi:PadR family transcriptional regulator PadR|nr:PadR family transcriptional regulator [Solirubrobacteraceae bacterium]
MADRRQQWLRGILDLCVLATLDEREGHGYAIARRLEAAGLAGIKGGTLYPLLARLHAAGHVSARWEPGEYGPGRKYYALTDDGRALLCEQGSAWLAFARTTEKLIERRGPP